MSEYEIKDHEKDIIRSGSVEPLPNIIRIKSEALKLIELFKELSFYEEHASALMPMPSEIRSLTERAVNSTFRLTEAVSRLFFCECFKDDSVSSELMSEAAVFIREKCSGTAADNFLKRIEDIKMRCLIMEDEKEERLSAFVSRSESKGHNQTYFYPENTEKTKNGEEQSAGNRNCSDEGKIDKVQHAESDSAGIGESYISTEDFRKMLQERKHKEYRKKMDNALNTLDLLSRKYGCDDGAQPADSMYGVHIEQKSEQKDKADTQQKTDKYEVGYYCEEPEDDFSDEEDEQYYELVRHRLGL